MHLGAGAVRTQRHALGLICALSILGCSLTDERVGPPNSGPEQQPETTAPVSSGTLVDARSGHRLTPIRFSDLRGWRDDDVGAVGPALTRSCQRQRASDGLLLTAAEWRALCQRVLATAPSSLRTLFERDFTPVSLGPRERGLLTAYFEPVLEARRRPDQVFRYPIYRKPPEVSRRGDAYGAISGGRLRPFYSRAQIDAGALRGRGLEIAWLADPVDLFFLHIQGSGRLRLGNGELIRVGFAAKNGHAYKSVGRAMIQRGWARSGGASAAAIKAFYRADPRRGRELLAVNKSYIFFREIRNLDARAGPVGAQGVQLTNGRSIAVDRRFIELGLPVWVDAPNTPSGPRARLTIAQDTGSAIKGSQRADFYMGSGAEAGRIAGRFQTPVRLVTLLPNSVLEEIRRGRR